MSVVGLVQTGKSHKHLKHDISTVLDLIDFKPDRPVNSIVIKPNLCYYWDAATGCTTDPAVVAGIIDYSRERFGEDAEIKIVEADATAMRTKYAFPVLGYEKLAREKHVELYNLSKDELVERQVKVNNLDLSFSVPKILLTSNLFINVPKLKIMRATKITCAMKNIFGCIGSPRKVVYHRFLNEAIIGINKLLRPEVTVVDGLVALSRFPVKLGLIMAGRDSFSVDWVAAQILRYNPSKIGFLKTALKNGFRKVDKISVRGVNINEFRKKMPKAGFTSTSLWWDLLFWLLKMYQRVVGDVIPPVLWED